MPGGHLATSLALSGVTYATTGSAEAATGSFIGGFLIDVDHYVDYLVFERQWRRPGPVDFLRYYFTNRPRRLVLPLHSAEFMAVLVVVLLVRPWPLIVGYWLGALMHLVFDVVVNGDYTLRRPVLFYFFMYRAAHGFQAETLLDPPPDIVVHAPVRDFFRWRPLEAGGARGSNPENAVEDGPVSVPAGEP